MEIDSRLSLYFMVPDEGADTNLHSIFADLEKGRNG